MLGGWRDGIRLVGRHRERAGRHVPRSGRIGRPFGIERRKNEGHLRGARHRSLIRRHRQRRGRAILYSRLSTWSPPRRRPGHGRGQRRRAACRPPSRDPADQRRHVGARSDLCEQLLDLALGPVRRSLQQEVPVPGSQVRRDHRDRGEVEPPVGEHGQEHRVLPGGASSGDAQVGLRPREVETVRAVLEHGRHGLAGVEPARVDLADVGDEIGLGVARRVHESGEPAQELVVGDCREGLRGLHTRSIRPVRDRAGPFCAGACDTAPEDDHPRRGSRRERERRAARWE
jgi:hypothetical protein